MDLSGIKDLLKKYREGTCTEGEKVLIEKWYDQLTDADGFQWQKEERETLERLLESRILEETGLTHTPEPKKVVRMNPVYWWAAASVVFILSSLIYFRYADRSDSSSVTTTIVRTTADDVKAPGEVAAMITLSDGRHVLLDHTDDGELAQQGNIRVVKLTDGAVAYRNVTGEEMSRLVYNTLSNPRGSRVVHVVLADGSKVWLNAGSSLTYPVAFIGGERRVSVSGEAYFEVAHDPAKPFFVSKGKMSVRVLGTHFNVNTFQDDGQGVEVTLLEGSVQVENGTSNGILKPGQQAKLGDQLEVVKHIDTLAVMAWKNGYFHFENASLQNVMLQVSRWYGVNVIYEGKIPDRQFIGEIQRDLSLSELVRILEKNGVRFKIEGRDLIVLPNVELK